MVFLIGLLTFVMVLDCLILILLVLIQLPKKEAGAGLAFGGAATDALFGAGSGNVLTKTTKYAAGAFFVLAVVLSLMQSHLYHRRANEFRRNLQQTDQPAPLPATPVEKSGPPASTAPTAPVAAPGNTNVLLIPPPANSAATTSNAAPGSPK
jgi:preprotein translocase subunit SecG